MYFETMKTQFLCAALAAITCAMAGTTAVFPQNDGNPGTGVQSPAVSKPTGTPPAHVDPLPESPDSLRLEFEETATKIKEIRHQLSELGDQKQEVAFQKELLSQKVFDEKRLTQMAELLQNGSATNKAKLKSLELLIRQFSDLTSGYYFEVSDRALQRKWDAFSTKLQDTYFSNEVFRYYQQNFSETTPENFTFELAEIEANYGAEKFKQAKLEVLAQITQTEQQLETIVNDKKGELSNLLKRKTDIESKLNGEEANITTWAITLGLPLFSITVLILYCIPFWERRFFVSKECDLATVPNIFDSGVLTEIVTIFLLVMTILILGLAKIIEGEVLGTLIGGISGYVLNRIANMRRETVQNGQSGAPAKSPAGKTKQ